MLNQHNKIINKFLNLKSHIHWNGFDYLSCRFSVIVNTISKEEKSLCIYDHFILDENSYQKIIFHKFCLWIFFVHLKIYNFLLLASFEKIW